MPFIQLHGLIPKTATVQHNGPAHQTLACGPLLALFSNFPETTTFENYSGDELAQWALNHNAILQEYCLHGPVFPMAPGAVFSSQKALKDAVCEDMPSHVSALTALREMQEFVIKLKAIPQTAPSVTQCQEGVQFLRAKRDSRNLRHKINQTQKTLATEVIARLHKTARSVRLVPATKTKDLVNASALIDKSAIKSLRHTIQDLGPKAHANGLEFTITGPCPPYSYASELGERPVDVT